MRATSNRGVRRRCAGHALIAAALVCAAALGASASPPLSLSRLTARLDQDGPKRTVDDLWRENRWGGLIDQIAAGRSDWIALAPRLAPGTDGHTAESLGRGLALALPKNAQAVLAVLDANDDAVTGADVVCSAAQLYGMSASELARHKRGALAALRRITDPRLDRAKRACAAHLAKL
jgi:hypothetical protein